MEGYMRILNEATATPHAQTAISEAKQAIAALRFHEGLRRRWENARAEAAVREATAVALLEGARTSVDDMRLLSMGHPSSPADALAVGIWRSQWNMATAWPALNMRHPHARTPHPPVPALMAGIHRDVCSALVARGLLPTSGVAIPQSPASVRMAASLLAATQRHGLSAWAVASDMWARFRTTDVFTPWSGAVGAALARWVLVTRGVEPTGVSVISAWHTVNTTTSAHALRSWAMAQDPTLNDKDRIDHMAQWVHTFACGVTHGVQIGTNVALQIQAGRLSG